MSQNCSQIFESSKKIVLFYDSNFRTKTRFQIFELFKTGCLLIASLVIS